ncbi:lipopolysaccharide biosynthesis protein [Adlercreutzia faecimuris]|nr:lipopolysaccharide biosynthesis protein [Adlercreutzia sp. JBNU-10]
MAGDGRTIRSFAWSFLEQGGSKAVLMIVQIVLARILSPEAFGVLAIVLVVTSIADSIAQSGLGMALVQKTDADDRSYSTAWWISLVLAAVLYVIIFASAPFVASLYRIPDLEGYLRVLGIVVFFNSAISIQRSHLQRSLNFKPIFKSTTIAALASGVVGIVLAFLGFGVWALVVQSLLQSVVTSLVMRFQLRWKPRLFFSGREAWELFGYGWKICVTGILNVLYSGVSELVIGRACSASDLGLYSQGRKYPLAAIGVISNSIANVLFPTFSLVKNEKEVLRERLKQSLAVGSFMVAPLSLLFAALAEPLVAILLTEKWLPCVPIFQLTCLSNSVLMFQLVNLRAYMALGNSALYLKLQIIKVLGGGGAIWATAVISHDIYATAIATFVVGILSVLVVDMAPARRILGYGALDQIRDQMPIFLLAIIAFSAAFFTSCLQIPYVAELLLQSLVFGVVFLGGAKLLHFKELDQVTHVASGLLRRKS